MNETNEDMELATYVPTININDGDSFSENVINNIIGHPDERMDIEASIDYMLDW
jgi:hypothetical protein